MKKIDHNRYKKSLKLINKIQTIRSKNNVQWMDLLRLALKLDPKKTSKLLFKILNYDQEISKIAKQLAKINK
tara:strand:+ start:781 stop:996 length:216 start_codon:yes stop_codon:yes gene_type:complete